MWRVFFFTNILIAPSTCKTYKVRTADGKEHIVKAREGSEVFPDLELGKNHNDYNDNGKIKHNRQIDPIDEDELDALLTETEEEEEIGEITDLSPSEIAGLSTPENITSNGNSNNVKVAPPAAGGNDAEAEKICPGLQVISECNANCLNAVYRCRGSEQVREANAKKDSLWSSVMHSESTYSTAWTVPDAREGDRCSLKCPGENNNSFVVTCKKHIMDKKADPPKWFGLAKVKRTCKSYKGMDKSLFFRV